MRTLRMPPLREISSLEFFHDGGKHILGIPVPFSRTWTLQGYDENGKLICSVNKSENNNYNKYVRFIAELEHYGYKLRKTDRLLLKSGAKDFLIASFLSQATRNDLYEITKISKTRHEVDSIRNEPEAVQRDFAELNGLEYHEFLEILASGKF